MNAVDREIMPSPRKFLQLDGSFLQKLSNIKVNVGKFAVALVLGTTAVAALAAPDFNISAYNYDTQPTPLPTSGTDTFRVSVGSVGDAPGATPVQVSIQVPAGVAVVPGSFPSYCVLAGSTPVSPSTSGTQVLQCTLPSGAIGGVGTSTEISYIGRAVVPNNSAYAFEACVDSTFSNAYPVATANCQPYPGDGDSSNDINGQSLLISAANDLAIKFVPAAPENVVSGAPYTFTANVTSRGLDPVPANQVQAEFNVQPGFQPASIAAINAASPGWNCSQVLSKITCVLSSAVASNPTGVLTNLPNINIPGTVVAGGGTTGMDAAVASNDNVATIADPVPADNGPVIKTINVQPGGNLKADKIFVGQPGAATATLAVTASSTMRLTIASDPGGSPVPAGAKVSDDLTAMLAKGFVVSAVPADCVFTTPNLVCTTSSSLAAGGQVNFDIGITHPLTLPATPAGINTAVVTAPTGYKETNPSDNTKPAAYKVVPAYADLEIVPFEALRKVVLGATITRGVGVKNNGPLPVVYGPANPLRAFGNIAPVENGGTGVPTCPPTLTAPWQNCSVSGTRLLFDTGTNTGTLPVGSTTPPASFTSTAPTAPAAAGTGPSTQVCTGQKILDTLGVATSAGANPPERTGVNGVNVPLSAPSTEYANDCKNARGVEYIQNTFAGDLSIAKTVATLNAGQACDATTTGFATVQTLAAVATNNNALCFKMLVKNDNPNRAGVTWGDGGTYTHGAAKNYFISDNLPMYWGITGNAGENLPTTQSVTLNPVLGTGETCATDFSASPPVVACNLVNLAPNATREMYIKVSRGMLDGTFVNTAITDSKDLLEPDDIPGSTGFASNNATATSIVNPVIDLVVVGKSLNPNPIPVGKLGQYVFTYKNLGPNPSQQARVEDVIDTSRWEIVGTPVNTRGESCSLLAGVPAAGRTTVRCDLNTIPFERAQEYQVAIQVRPLFPYAQPNNSADGFSDGVGSPGYVQSGGGLPLGTTIASMPGYTNTAVVAKTRAIETERDLTNNNNAVLVKVAPPKFDLIVAKTDVGTGLNGDNLSFPNQVKYRITIVNSGESKITGVQMVDLKPVPISGNVANFGATTAVTNNGAVRTLNFVSAVFEPSAQFASSGRTTAATPCTDNLPNSGQIRCLSSNNASDQYMLPGESFSWVLTFTPVPNTPFTRGNLILPNRVRGASNEAPFDMTAAGRVDYDKDSVRNAVENTTWFAPMDLEITAKTTISPTTINLNQTAQFNIDFRNNGPSPTRRIKITESLPPGFTFVSAAFVKPAGSAIPGVASNYPVSCTGVGQNVAVCEVGDAASTIADFVGPTGTGQLQVIAKASNWAAIQAAGFNPTLLNNVASIDPGTDLAGNSLGKDTNSTNNAKTSTIAVIETSISGRVCQVTQGVDLATAAVKNCAASPAGAISGTTIKICGTDVFGNTLGGGVPGAGADCADTTVSGQTDANGDWKILVPPGANYTVVEAQPAGYSDYTEQAGTGGGAVAIGPNAASPALSFGSSPDENKISGVAVPATGTAAQRNPGGYNFTEIVNTGLTGFVYEDLNNNGIKDLGESGISGVSIKLTGIDFDGNPVDITAQTDINGLYQFSVAPSSASGYTLTQIQPADYFDGKEHKGNATGTQAAGNVIVNSEANNSAQGYSTAGNPVPTGTTNTASDIITAVVLVEAQGQSQHNFGEIRAGTITGVVYVDSDGSVTKQSAEATLPGVTVTLSGTDFLGNAVTRTVVTNAGGTYTFGGLLPGDYNVQVSPVAGYTHTGSSVEGPNALGATYAPRTNDTPSIVPAAGSASGGVTTPAVSTIKLGPGGISQGNNFGERGSDMSGRVCEDLNNDGICQPGEPPIQNVTITLTGIDAAGNTITRTAVTSSTGSWVINDIPAPNSSGYTLEETQPAAYIDGRQSPGSLTPYAGVNSAPAIGVTTPTDVISAAKDKITGIKFNVATSGTNYDFAELKPASLQGFVYYDLNKDGTRTTSELGIIGVTLELTGTNDLGQPVALTTTTTVSPDGSYSFSNLRPGSYTIREIQPTTPAFTVLDGTVTVGSVAYTTPPVTPTANNGTLITETPSSTSGAGEGVSGIVLGSGGVGSNYNFGEIPFVSISGTVFLDKSLDGILTPGETGLPNNKTTTLTLCLQPTNPCLGSDIVSVTTTTPGSGTYTFVSVPSGSYYVVEDQPAGYASSSPNIQSVTAIQTPITGVNFAETGAKISGTVFADNNADGALQVGTEPGIAGATLKLCLTSSLPACASPIATTTTSSPGGTYTFADIPAPPAGETYTILEDESSAPLTTYSNGTATVGTLTGGTSMVNGTAPSTEQGPAYSGDSTVRGISFVMPTAVITGTTPVVGTNYNFGELPVAGISGRVFVDRDFTNGTTGTYNPVTDSPLVSNGTTTVTLCNVDPASNGGICPVASVAATTVTAADGAYSFPVVPAGNFWVIETQPVGYGSSSPNVVPVTRAGATSVTNVNFADTLAEIKGRVYTDDDASGTFTAGEAGIGNITVKLCLSTDSLCTSPVQTTTTTAISGTYTFANVLAPAPGITYFIKEEQSTVPATLQNGTTTVGSLVVGTAPGTPVGAANSTNNTINNISWTPSATVVNALQAVGTEYNFGELPISSISGRVFVDRDFTNGTTGTYNPATDGTLLNSATTTITLCSADPASTGGVCPPASVAGTTATAADGTYNFVNAPPGNYWVIESQPQGYGSSSPNVVPVTRTGTTPVSNINFADTLAEIKGTVYRDDNASGTLTPGEPGVGAVTVKLCLSTDTQCTSPVQTTTTTVISGTYTFANLVAPAPGTTYFIKEEQSTVPPTLQNGTTTVGSLAVSGGAATPVGTADTQNSVISNVTWTPSTSLVNGLSAVGSNYNFGELPVTTISGAVILDRDANGTLTPGESGLQVTTTVTLCRSAPAHGQVCPPADVVSVTTTTPGSGTYTFPGVTPGTYYVVETQPAGYGSSSPNTSAPINASTTPINGVNFYETGAIVSGTVYKDVDYSGAFNAGDTPLQSVTVRLCTTNNCAAGSVIATATTNGTGLYQFTDIAAPAAGRPYFIVEDQTTVPPTPTILGDGTSTIGTFALGAGATNGVPTVVQTPSRFENLTWTPATSVVTGTAGVVATNFNFGEILGFDVSGKVFFDQNRNGALDSPADSGLQGVLITLCRVSGVPCTGTNIVATTTTSLTGDYSFPKVPPGSYFMQEAQPLGYGSVPTTTAPGVTDVRPFTVATGAVTGIDFADTLSSIAGLVYRDDNGSMTRDGTEPTMPGGITITLTGIDATGAAVTRTVVTSATGSYAFDNLKTGTYTITESQPAAFGTGGSNPGTLAGGTGGPNSNTITNVVLPVNTDAPNYNFGDTPKTAGVAGTIWRDNDHDKRRDTDEPVLPGWTVQVLRTPVGGGTPTVLASAVTDVNGSYSITGLEAGGGYSVRFIAPGGAIFGGAVDGEQGAPVSGATVTRGEITNLTLTATVTGGPNVIPQQSLPVDPSGVIYDSDTRLPVAGAQVTFQPINCPAFNPAIHLVGGAANMTQTVGPDGFYQFLLSAGAPACEYRLAVTPPGQYIADPAIPPQPGPFTPPNRPPNNVLQIVPNATAPLEGQPTTYYLSFNLNDNSRDIVNNHIPLVSKNRPVLFITKVANKTKVELGDSVKYTVKVRYASGAVNLSVLKVVDTMPAGFKLIPETSYVSVPAGSPPVLMAAGNIAGAPGSVVTYNIPLPAAGFAPGSEIELSYRVRVAVGSMQGDGINRAQARSLGAVRSNIAQAKVIVDPGVFSNDGCVAGKVFIDCNNNHIQDAEELGVPGVKLYTEDGTYFVTDSEGKYSYCGLSPKSHVITVDMLTMPRGSRMTTTSNRNLGDGNSIYLDMKNGQLIRADFAEGSCSNTVLEQTKSRRAQGEVRSVETEKTGQPALKWEGKSPQYPQQGTDSANQPLIVPRSSNGGTSSVPEQNTPVPQMPGASSNTQGANVRNAP